MKAVTKIAALIAGLLLVGCGDNSTTYSLLSQGQTFRQNGATLNTKIDVLWVIDNSGSMLTSQENLAANFPVFINNFSIKGFDFQMGVVTTDAYLALPTWTPYYNSWKTTRYENEPQLQKAWFRDGIPTNRSGHRLMTPTTPNLANVFLKNATQGVNGMGDERSFQSMRTALESSGNAGFLRPGGFLAVIILTDEDDFSHDGTQAYSSYTAPIHTVDSYVSFLDAFTNSPSDIRRYSVNTIAVKDQACETQLGRPIGQRVNELATKSGGQVGNICGNFANELNLIANSIVERATEFFLDGNPIPQTIVVTVNASVTPNAATTNGNGGWTYNATNNSIIFSGNYIPPQGAEIKVAFDPESLTF